MKDAKLRLVLQIAAIAIGLCTSAVATGEDSLQRDIQTAKNKVYPALVNIKVVMQGYYDGRSMKAPASGSGVIVSPEGHVLTNYHVAEDALRITCRLSTREEVEAEVVAHDPLTDLSVLKLKLSERRDPTAPIAYAKLGDSDKIEVGDYVLAMGNPLALSSTTTLGIVSNKSRVFTSSSDTEMEEMALDDGEVTGLFTRWIQHDALILPGNSGGPLANLKGEIIGINELAGRGIGFAIPSNLASQVLKQALATGEVRRGWFGVSVAPVRRMHMERGALVTWVVPNGPADKAGIRAGDIIVAISSEPVYVEAFEQVPLLYQRMAECEEGKETTVDLLRGTAECQVKVTAARMQTYLGKEEEYRPLGVTVRDITGPMALVEKYPDDKGVVVTGVRPGKPADSAKPKVEYGDVVRSVNGKPVEDISDFAEKVRAAGKDVVLTVLRDEEEIVTVLDVSVEESKSGGAELPKAWMGIRTQVMTPKVAGAVGLSDTKGFRITQVYPGTEVAKSGLKTGDVITKINDTALKAYRVQDYEMLTRIVEDLIVGTTAKLAVLRDGETKEIDVLLEATPLFASRADTAKNDFFEFSVRGLVFMDRISNKWSLDEKGVLVGDVTTGGWAHVAGLRSGDLIVSIQDQDVNDVAAFKDMMKKISADKPELIKIFVRRAHMTTFVFIEPDWTKFEVEGE